MKYSRQIQGRLEDLNRSLLQLSKLIKAGKQQEAIEFMDNGPLKDVYEELQNIMNISSNGNFGARGVQNTGTL